MRGNVCRVLYIEIHVNVQNNHGKDDNENIFLDATVRYSISTGYNSNHQIVALLDRIIVKAVKSNQLVCGD